MSMLPPPALLLLLALCGAPAAAFTTPPPSDGGQLTDELQLPDDLQLSEEDLQLLQLPDHQLDVLLQQLQAADPANGSRWSAAATTSERRRQCDEQGAGPPPPNHCRLTWDEALCWPESPPGTLVLLPCFKEFRGIIYPKGGNNTASRYCHVNGTWDATANYSDCIPLFSEVLPPPDEFRRSEYTSIIYLIGYSLSLASLTVATAIFAYCRDLRCLRNTIHANLFITYILTDSLWIITLSMELGVGHPTFTCVIAVLLHYCLVATFFWMFVEGVPLLVMITWALVKVRTSEPAGRLAAGGSPQLESLISDTGAANTMADGWSVAPVLDEQGGYSTQCRWLSSSHWDWIYLAPALLVLSFNIIFLMRIMWVLITKLRSTNSAETQQYKKATKALLVLLPLLGVTYILVLAPPTDYGMLETVFAYLQAVLISTQGLAVALIYCFFNSEVRASLRTHYRRWNMERSMAEFSGISHRQEGFPSSRRRSSATEMTYTVTEAGGQGCGRLRRASGNSQAGREQLATV
ncbi:Diuretic hormone receptor [Amphibalanus amphitrite]|uniref:Diuretic hormone receptor n=1 Tax=Amphibalanus amphitrite TaxID=1232801 RepID=A0A6A4V058_AMPAM|nr:Diuretic hormone receptor [Amphibalanus amphitrite]